MDELSIAPQVCSAIANTYNGNGFVPAGWAIASNNRDPWFQSGHCHLIENVKERQLCQKSSFIYLILRQIEADCLLQNWCLMPKIGLEKSIDLHNLSIKVFYLGRRVTQHYHLSKTAE